MKINLFQILMAVFGPLAVFCFLVFCALGSDGEWTRAIVALVAFIISTVIVARAIAVDAKRREKK